MTRALRVAACVLAVLAVPLLVAPGQATAMQVGAYPPGSDVELAARSGISQPSAHENGHYGTFYWIGIDFPNGWFIQTGYMDASDQYSDLCQTGFSTFTTVLWDNEFVSGDGTYNPTNCNLTGTHAFKLAIETYGSTYVGWRAYMSGNPIGPQMDISKLDYDFTKEMTSTVSEIANCSGTGCPALNSSTPFATVEYSPAMEFLPDGSSTWDTAHHAYSTVNGPDYNCNWFSLYVFNTNDFETGKTTSLPASPCYSVGDVLW